MKTIKQTVSFGMMVATVMMFWAASNARATLIVVRPVSVTASSNVGDARQPIRTIDSSGLSTGANSYPTGSAVPGVWATQDGTDANAGWLNASNEISWMIWDLGASYNIVGYHLWNSPEVTRGIQTGNILISDSPTFATTNAFSAGIWTQSNGTTTDPGLDYSFTGTGRYVQFRNLANVTSPQLYQGIGEIRFEAVPEPSTVMLLGLGGLLLFRRRFAGNGEQGRQNNFRL